MNTIIALFIAFIACGVGTIGIGFSVLILGLIGLPGAYIYFAGRKIGNTPMKVIGFGLSTVGQTYAQCAYIVFVIGLLHFISSGKPEMPTWPLWLAAFFHSGVGPARVMTIQENAKNKSNIHLSTSISFAFSLLLHFSRNLYDQAIAEKGSAREL